RITEFGCQTQHRTHLHQALDIAGVSAARRSRRLSRSRREHRFTRKVPVPWPFGCRPSSIRAGGTLTLHPQLATNNARARESAASAAPIAGNQQRANMFPLAFREQPAGLETSAPLRSLRYP